MRLLVQLPCALVTVCFAPSGLVLAQSAEEPEEIIVRAKPLNQYRVEVELARDEMIRVFNEANEGEDNDVRCRYEAPTGSHIPQRVCFSVSQDRASADAARDFLVSMVMSSGSASGGRAKPVGSGEAQKAAGRSAFATGDYRLAASLLAGAGELDADDAHHLSVSRAVLSLDPLAPRLAPASRVARTARITEIAMTTAAGCPSVPPATPQNQLDSVLTAVRRSAGRDLDAIADVVDAASMQIEAVSRGCGLSDPSAQAVLIIGERLKATTP